MNPHQKTLGQVQGGNISSSVEDVTFFLTFAFFKLRNTCTFLLSFLLRKREKFVEKTSWIVTVSPYTSRNSIWANLASKLSIKLIILAISLFSATLYPNFRNGMKLEIKLQKVIFEVIIFDVTSIIDVNFRTKMSFRLWKPCFKGISIWVDI